MAYWKITKHIKESLIVEANSKKEALEEAFGCDFDYELIKITAINVDSKPGRKKKRKNINDIKKSLNELKDMIS